MNGQDTFDSVIISKIEHLYTLQLAVDSLNRYTKVNKIYIVTPLENFPKINKIANNIILVDEDKLIPFMTIMELRNLTLPGFPEAAGWYFQQLLKLGCAYIDGLNEKFLVWDADTILLRPLDFFDGDKLIFTIGSGYHSPYFDSFKNLIGIDPKADYSLIAQHMPMNKKIIIEILNKIADNFAGSDNWAWKIMNNLSGDSKQLFSEYECFGHFVKIIYPGRFVTRSIPWLRFGTRISSLQPSSTELNRLAKRYFFASFEIWDTHKPWKRPFFILRELIKYKIIEERPLGSKYGRH